MRPTRGAAAPVSHAARTQRNRVLICAYSIDFHASAPAVAPSAIVFRGCARVSRVGVLRISHAGTWIATRCTVGAITMKQNQMSDSIRSIPGIGGVCALSFAFLFATDLAAAAAAIDDNEGLAEVVVTAEKVVSTIQDTPISISALSSNQLEAQGITSIEEVARDVPGMSVRSAGPGLTEYDARGLASNGGAAPTVGFYLDEIPLSPPALSQSGKVVIDPGIYDVDRVEVLRGPQGTLYGSGSMGGTVKIVTAQPKLNQFEGSAQVTGSYTDGGGANGGGNLMLNLPIGEQLAVRIVRTDLYRSGWIDRIVVNPFPTGGVTRGEVLTAPVQSVAND